MTTTTPTPDNHVMNANTHHAHDATCRASNELNEMCCNALPITHDLTDFCRHTVRVTVASPSPPNRTYDVHTFTDSDDDAIALVLADDPSLALDDVTLTVVFRDTAHALDEHAVFGRSIDVPNPS